MTKPEDSFWAALTESLLDSMFGPYQRRMWREEDKQRAECEAVAKKHQNEAYRLMLGRSK